MKSAGTKERIGKETLSLELLSMPCYDETFLAKSTHSIYSSLISYTLRGKMGYAAINLPTDYDFSVRQAAIADDDHVRNDNVTRTFAWRRKTFPFGAFWLLQQTMMSRKVTECRLSSGPPPGTP